MVRSVHIATWRETPAETLTDSAPSDELLDKLNGLPLEIAQAGAYLQESDVTIRTYLKFYNQCFGELMESNHQSGPPLQDYPHRSIWTTWTITYNAIREKDEATANLLLLWSFLDNRDLWYGLFAEPYKSSEDAAHYLYEWIGDLATNELRFVAAAFKQLLIDRKNWNSRKLCYSSNCS